MWTTWSGFSQGLKPRIQLNKGDTFLCFNLAQSRELAKELLRGRYCDSLNSANEAKIALQSQLSEVKDTTINFLRQQVSVQGNALEKSGQIISQQGEDLNTAKLQIKSARRQRTVLIVCSLILLTSLVLK